MRDPVPDARDLVRERFPQARWAVVTGSVVTPHRTEGSDLDIVVVLPDHDPASPSRESLRWRDWPVELFIHDESTLWHYVDKDGQRRQASLIRMVAIGVPLLESTVDYQDRCRALLAAGPGSLTADELDDARYSLSDLLDDLAHSTDPVETAINAADAWRATAQLACDLAGTWRGGGKWAVRELRAADPEFASRWASVRTQPSLVASLAREVLERAGGPLFEGYRRVGTRPS